MMIIEKKMCMHTYIGRKHKGRYEVKPSLYSYIQQNCVYTTFHLELCSTFSTKYSVQGTSLNNHVPDHSHNDQE